MDLGERCVCVLFYDGVTALEGMKMFSTSYGTKLLDACVTGETKVRAWTLTVLTSLARPLPCRRLEVPHMLVLQGIATVCGVKCCLVFCVN